MPKIYEKPSAAYDVEKIVEYLHQHGLLTSQRFLPLSGKPWKTYEWLSRVPEGSSAVEELSNSTYHGMRVSRVKSFKHYLVFYLPIPDGVVIYHVVDGRRDYLRTIFDTSE